MKDNFREHFRDYVAAKLRTPFDNLNDKQRSVWMARYYADQIIRSLNPGLIPEGDEDLDACLIDGKHDCGVDFLSRQGNTVLILQAKYSGTKKSGKKATEKAETFDYFRGVLTRLYTGPSKYEMNQPLTDAIAEIDWEKDNFILHYITLQQPAESSYTNAEAGVDPLPELPDLGERESLELLDNEKLNQSLRDALLLDKAPTQTISLRFSPDENSDPWLAFEETHSHRKSYVGRVNGAHVAELFRQHKSGLFALNIRNYIGDTGTNKAIRKTATSKPGDFFYANNGICAVATRVRPDEEDESNRTLLCDRFSIINGAQTVRSLAKAHTENSAALRNVEILLRLVEYESKITQAEQTFLDSIIRNNNTQNAIKISDFRSNDRVQISLQQHFAKLPALKGKTFVYRNKRTGERDSLHHPIAMEEFTKTVHAFRFGPDDIYGGTSYLFSLQRDGGYFKLFGDGVEIKAALTTEEFDSLAGTWFLCELIKELWKERLVDSLIPALERRWLVFWAVGESIRLIYENQSKDLEKDIQRLSDPGWLDDKSSKESHYRAAVERHYKLATQVLKKAYEQVAKIDGFSHRNWFRVDSTLTAIRKELESFLLLTSQMADQYLLRK